VAAVGTDFQQRVWRALRGIAYGSTTSYLQLSEQLGDRLAIRAVANANGNNCVALLLPCHRVIGTDGSLTGYGGGLERKKLLLELEARHSQQHYQPSLF
jgi:O-6-methylguanine DNA methyltransferase